MSTWRKVCCCLFAAVAAFGSFAEDAGGVWVKFAFRRIVKDGATIQLSELGVFDHNGNRLNLSLGGVDGADPKDLAVRKFTTNGHGANATDVREGASLLFDGSMGTSKLCKGLSPKPQPNDETSWWEITMRLADDAQPLAYNLMTANDSEDSRSPVSWTVFISKNGTDWTQVDARDDQPYPTTHNTWYNGGANYTFRYPWIPFEVSKAADVVPYVGNAPYRCGIAVNDYADPSKVLTEGEDYDVVYENDTGIGTASVTVTGKGGVYGGATWNSTYRIVPGFTVSLLRTAMPYAGGAPRECGVAVSNYNGTAELVKDVHYKVEYANNTEIGTATVTVTGLGDYAQNAQVLNFTIEPGFVVYKLHDVLPYADGEPVVCGVVVSNYAGTAELRESVDYTVQYANNTAVGTATVTVTGINEFEGNIAEDSFDIAPRGVWVRVEFRRTSGGTGKEIQLSELAFYDEQTNRVNLSLGDAGVDKPAHKLSVRQFTATATTGNDPTEHAFDGDMGTKMCKNSMTAVPMTITMRLKDDAMPVGYNFATANDSESSRSPVSWTVWASKDAVNWTAVDVQDNQPYPTTHKTWYNGGTNWVYRYPWIPMEMQLENRVVPFSGVREYTCGVIVTDYESYETLTEGADYDVAYSDNTKVGTARVTVTGRGKYKGAVLTDTFEIAPSMYVRFLDDTVEYDYVHPCTIRIEVLSEEGGEPLVEGTHYRIDYANNAAVGKATATVTGIGDFEGNVFSHEFTVVSAFVRVPAKYSIVSPSDVRTVVKRGEELILKDGAVTGYVTDADYATGYMMDFGTPRRIRLIGVGPRPGENGKYLPRANAYRAYGSNDLADWTLLRSGDPDMAENVLSKQVPTNGTDRAYRYLRITNVMNINEIAAFSDDLMVELTSDALPFASTACAAADAASVPVKGRVIKAPHGAPRVVAFAAQTDFGDDYAAWQAQAEARIDFGEVAKDGTFQGGFEGLAKGRWHWRVFAVDAEGVSASQATVPFTVGTRVVYPKAYVANAALAKCYDKETDYWGDTSGNLWIVFDLKGAVPASCKLDGIRAWCRPGGNQTESFQSRMRAASIDFGWDPAEGPVDWGAETDTTVDRSRPVAQVSGVPAGIVWKNNVANFVEQSVNDYGSPYVLFQKVKASNPPRYVRIRDFTKGNISEIEFRALRQLGIMLFVK